MKMKAIIILAGLLSSTILAGTALAADTSNLPLAAKQGDRATMQSLLSGLEKKDVAGANGTAALVWAVPVPRDNQHENRASIRMRMEPGIV